KSKSDYETALASVDRLIALDPESGTPDADELEVLTVLVKDYESRLFPINIPDPIEALSFRMQQMGMSPRDLVPLFGTRARVSEVLSRRRTLSLNMRRALHLRLGIPASTLLAGEHEPSVSTLDKELAQFPISEMVHR